VACRNRADEFGAAGQAHIQIERVRSRLASLAVDGPADDVAVEFDPAGDRPDLASFREPDHRDLAGGYVPIVSGFHFLAGRQIEPQLEPAHPTFFLLRLLPGLTFIY